MTPLVLVLPEVLQAFLEAEVARTGCGSPTAYLAGLLEHAREKAVAARLEALLLAGLASERVPAPEAFGEGAADTLVHRAACDDVRRELDRYAARGLDAIATRFERAVRTVAQAAGNSLSAGEPRSAADPALAGLQAWPVKGFSGLRVYGVVRDGRLIVLRVLHDTRDLAPETVGETAQSATPQFSLSP